MWARRSVPRLRRAHGLGLLSPGAALSTTLSLPFGRSRRRDFVRAVFSVLLVASSPVCFCPRQCGLACFELCGWIYVSSVMLLPAMACLPTNESGSHAAASILVSTCAAPLRCAPGWDWLDAECAYFRSTW